MSEQTPMIRITGLKKVYGSGATAVTALDNINLTVNKGDILTRDQLTIQIWGETYAGETLGVAVYIRRIREKIEDNPSKPRYVQTVWREGYRFGD